MADYIGRYCKAKNLVISGWLRAKVSLILMAKWCLLGAEVLDIAEDCPSPPSLRTVSWPHRLREALWVGGWQCHHWFIPFFLVTICLPSLGAFSGSQHGMPHSVSPLHPTQLHTTSATWPQILIFHLWVPSLHGIKCGEFCVCVGAGTWPWFSG